MDFSRSASSLVLRQESRAHSAREADLDVAESIEVHHHKKV